MSKSREVLGNTLEIEPIDGLDLNSPFRAPIEIPSKQSFGRKNYLNNHSISANNSASNSPDTKFIKDIGRSSKTMKFNMHSMRSNQLDRYGFRADEDNTPVTKTSIFNGHGKSNFHSQLQCTNTISTLHNLHVPTSTMTIGRLSTDNMRGATSTLTLGRCSTKSSAPMSKKADFYHPSQIQPAGATKPSESRDTADDDDIKPEEFTARDLLVPSKIAGANGHAISSNITLGECLRTGILKKVMPERSSRLSNSTPWKVSSESFLATESNNMDTNNNITLKNTLAPNSSNEHPTQSFVLTSSPKPPSNSVQLIDFKEEKGKGQQSRVQCTANGNKLHLQVVCKQPKNSKYLENIDKIDLLNRGVGGSHRSSELEKRPFQRHKDLLPASNYTKRVYRVGVIRFDTSSDSQRNYVLIKPAK